MKNVKGETECAKATNACGTYTENEEQKQGELLERQKESREDKVMKAQRMRFQGECDQRAPRLN